MGRIEKMVAGLKLLGLTKNDAKVYLCIAERGPIGPSEIEDNTGVSRPRVYDSKDRLMERGYIVQALKGKRKVYRITDPNILLDKLTFMIETGGDALKTIEEFVKRTPLPVTAGTYQFADDHAFQREVNSLIKDSHQRITILARDPRFFEVKLLLPFKLLIQKSTAGQYVTLIIPVTEENWEKCHDLFENNAIIYHYPGTVAPIAWVLIDENIVCLSLFDDSSDGLKLREGTIQSYDEDYLEHYLFAIKNIIGQSDILKTRLNNPELKEKIAAKLKSKAYKGNKIDKLIFGD